MSFSQDMDDEYEKLIRRMNPPRYIYSLSLPPKYYSILFFFFPFEILIFIFGHLFLRVVIDNESCKNATVIQVISLLCLFSLDLPLLVHNIIVLILLF